MEQRRQKRMERLLRAFLADAHVGRVAVAALGDGLPHEEVLALIIEALGDLPEVRVQG